MMFLYEGDDRDNPIDVMQLDWQLLECDILTALNVSQCGDNMKQKFFSEISVSEDIKKLVDDLIEKINFKSTLIKYYNGSQIGDGYGSVTIAVEIRNDEEILNLFLKCTKNVKDTDKVETDKIYANEIYFYATIYPEYMRFLQDKGDCWSNNMMVLYEDELEEIPLDVMLIDWQLIRKASPVHDIMNLFFSVISKESLDNCDKYKTIYYEELSRQIRQTGSDPDKRYQDTQPIHHPNARRFLVQQHHVLIRG
ncbi:Ecdysteroid kinase-like family [Popillia japonica]|uniref:Ecdysteroid kinase-like family n=1 Tax=Popillia japonica TaxID=7064 RepID=A0AAW1LF02_POPJA